MVHVCDANTKEVGAEESMQVWGQPGQPQGVLGHPGLHNGTLSQVIIIVKAIIIKWYANYGINISHKIEEKQTMLSEYSLGLN